jgi:hypothetical protein
MKLKLKQKDVNFLIDLMYNDLIVTHPPARERVVRIRDEIHNQWIKKVDKKQNV